MKFTGKNLCMLQSALACAIAELHNRIATCPDVLEYADHIEALDTEQAGYERLLTRVEKAIAKEQGK